jgi:hypothetical protein
MRGDRATLRESPVAHGTSERFLAGMRSRMCGQIRGLAEGFRARVTPAGERRKSTTLAGKWTRQIFPAWRVISFKVPERLLPRVSTQMGFQGAGPGIGFAAYPAQVGPAVVFGGDGSRGHRSHATYADRVFASELQTAGSVMRLGVRMRVADQ